MEGNVLKNGKNGGNTMGFVLEMVGYQTVFKSVTL